MKKTKKFDAVALKRKLQDAAGKRLSRLSEKEQLALLREKFGHLTKQKEKARSV